MTPDRGSRRATHVCSRIVLAVAAAVFASTGAAQSRTFPDRGVRMIIPYAPSGVIDITSRTLAKELTDLWGQTVVVENKPGAAGVIAADAVAKSPGDGYTLLFADDGVVTTMPIFQSKLPYDPATDLLPVGMVGMFPYLLLAHSSLQVKTVAELLGAAKARAAGLDYATNGVGGTQHLSWERLQRAAGVKLNHIPYKSAPPALQDVLAGRVAMMFTAIATAFPFTKDPRIVPIATGGPTRSPVLPDLPTMIEAGFPGFELISWMAVFAPKGTPPALVESISRDLAKVTQSPGYAARLAERGSETRTSTPQELARRVREEHERNVALVQSLGIKMDK